MFVINQQDSSSLIVFHLRISNFYSETCIFALTAKKPYHYRDGYLQKQWLRVATTMDILEFI
jgi:hypothetical protein